MKSVELKQGIILGASTALALLILVLTHSATRGKIEETAQRTLNQTLEQLLPVGSYDNNPATDTIELSHSSLGSSTSHTIYRARNNNQATGAVVSALAPDGYNGNIALLVGFTFDGDITGVRVTSHKETPGLGDDIELSRSNWIKSFDKLEPSNMPASKWQVKKDGGRFDQFTGATITPRAVIHAVHRVADWYQLERNTIYAAQP